MACDPTTAEQQEQDHQQEAASSETPAPATTPAPAPAPAPAQQPQASTPVTVTITPPAESAKASLRTKTWQQMHSNNLIVKQPWHNFLHTIPNYVGSADSVALLKDLEEFKNATHVMVNPDKSQYGVRMACLQENKNLYVFPPRFVDYLMTSYKPKEGATISDLEEALIVRNLTETKNRITVEKLDNHVPLDMIVIGSVMVTREGRQLGIGRGYVDFYMALLTQLKLLTPQTLIVTTVHDSQIVDALPSELFGPHDFPVDIIVTPTEVIRVNKTYERPAGILWNVISERRLKRIPVINYVREKDIEAGNPCVLKEEDSDHESDKDDNQRSRRFYRGRRFIRRRRPMFNRTNGTTNESDNYERGQDNSQTRRNFQRRYYRSYRGSGDGPSKASFRDKAWELLRISKVCTSRRSFYDQIPGFKDSQIANEKLRETEIYKNATNILVSGDNKMEQFRQFCLEDGKKLFILMHSGIKGIIRIDVPEATEEQEKPDLKTVNSKEGFEKFGVKLTSADKYTVDLIVVGSAAVSKDGYRVGNGHGDIDIYYGLLTHMEVITPETSIATMVHDYQIFETFPNDMFEEHDMPVHLIVTPTQIIETKYSGPKTKGIYWDLMTERRLKFFPDLKTLRDQLVESGNECTLREVVQKPRPRYRRFNRNHSKNVSENETTNEPVDSDTQNNGKVNGHRRFVKKRYNGNYYNDENQSPDSTTNRPKRSHKRKQFDFCIRVSNIAKNYNSKDLKTALEERKVKPTYLKWNGYRGYSLLYFSKPNAQPENENFNAESIIESLANLTLYPRTSNPESTNPESASEVPVPNKLVIQMGRMKPLRIETTDETTV